MVYQYGLRLAARLKSGGPSLGRSPGAHKQRRPVNQDQIQIFGEIGSTQFLRAGLPVLLFFCFKQALWPAVLFLRCFERIISRVRQPSGRDGTNQSDPAQCVFSALSRIPSARFRGPTGRPRSGMPGGSCWTELIASSLSARHQSRRLKSSLPLEEVRADVGFLLDRVVVAIDAVGDKRVARNDRVLVRLDRVQSDHRSMGPGIPFKRSRTLGLLAGRDG